MTEWRYPPVVCFVGPSNVGKTTLVSRVIGALAETGLRVGALKHASHRFDMDREGKDTWHFRRAGAAAIAIASKTERALIATTETPWELPELLDSLPPGIEFAIVEGYKSQGAPTIEVHRGDGPLLPEVPGRIAVATDRPEDPSTDCGVPRFAIDDAAGVAAFLLRERPRWR